MTNIDLDAGDLAPRLGRVVRYWWPVPAFVAGALLAQQWLLGSRYDVGGHAAEHLAGASAPFLAAAVLSSLFWATPTARRQVDVLAAAGSWYGSTALVMIGNLRVVDDLVAAGYSRTPTDSVPDVADHALANSAIWLAWATSLLLIGACRRRRHIGNRATVGAVAATMVIPPWIVPGAGVVVLAIVRIVRRGRGGRVDEAGRAGPARAPTNS